MLTSDSLSFEQCTFKAFETDAAYMTYNYNDARCICKDSTAFLTTSTELSTAFMNECYVGFVTTKVQNLNIENQAIVYPNPTYSEFILEINSTSLTLNDRNTLFSMAGQKIHTSQIHSQQTKIILSNYPKGIYLIHIHPNKTTILKKVVKF